MDTLLNDINAALEKIEKNNIELFAPFDEVVKQLDSSLDKNAAIAKVTQEAVDYLKSIIPIINGIDENMMSHDDTREECTSIYYDTISKVNWINQFKQYVPETRRMLVENLLYQVECVVEYLESSDFFTSKIKNAENEQSLKFEDMVKYITSDADSTKFLFNEYLRFMGSDDQEKMVGIMLTHIYVLYTHMKEFNVNFTTLMPKITVESERILKVFKLGPVENQVKQISEIVPKFATDLDHFCRNIIKIKEIKICSDEISEFFESNIMKFKKLDQKSFETLKSRIKNKSKEIFKSKSGDISFGSNPPHAENLATILGELIIANGKIREWFSKNVKDSSLGNADINKTFKSMVVDILSLNIMQAANLCDFLTSKK